MCCCGKPVVNGEMGYKWQPNDNPRICPVNPPALEENDQLLRDEPGRCGGTKDIKQRYPRSFARKDKKSDWRWFCVRCGAAKTSADWQARRCTQCGRRNGTEATT